MDISDYVLGFIEHYTSNLLNDENQSIPTQAVFALHDTANKFRTNRTSGIALNVTFSLGRIDSTTYSHVQRHSNFLSHQLPPLITEPLSEIFLRNYSDALHQTCPTSIKSWNKVYRSLIMATRVLLEMNDSHTFTQRRFMVGGKTLQDEIFLQFVETTVDFLKSREIETFFQQNAIVPEFDFSHIEVKEARYQKRDNDEMDLRIMEYENDSHTTTEPVYIYTPPVLDVISLTTQDSQEDTKSQDDISFRSHVKSPDAVDLKNYLEKELSQKIAELNSTGTSNELHRTYDSLATVIENIRDHKFSNSELNEIKEGGIIMNLKDGKTSVAITPKGILTPKNVYTPRPTPRKMSRRNSTSSEISNFAFHTQQPQQGNFFTVAGIALLSVGFVIFSKNMNN